MYKGVWEVLGRLTRFLEFPVFLQCYLNIFDHTAVSIKKKGTENEHFLWYVFYLAHCISI